MLGTTQNINYFKLATNHLVIDTRDSYTCSFTEFLPFHSAMYYYSSFKAFEINTPA